MKKILLSAIMLLIFAGVANASSLNGTYEGNPIAKIIVNGEEIDVSGTPAYVDGGSVMVPVKVLRELGVKVSWDQATYSVNLKPPEPVFVIKEVVKEVIKYVQADGTVVDPDLENTSSTGTVEPTPTPTNTVACQAIRDDYAVQIVMTGYTESTIAKQRLKVLQLEYARDKALSNAGC